MKPHAAPSHAAPASHTGHAHAEPAASEFASLLGRAVGGVRSAPPETTPFEALLQGRIATHAGQDPRKVLLICGCGNRYCPVAGQDGKGFIEVDVD